MDDVRQLLSHFDEDERRRAVFPGLRREALPRLVRHVDLVGRTGVVIYSRLWPASLDEAVREQIDYFRSLGQSFEWKAFAHDEPPDLVDRLAALGFDIDQREAILVLDVQSAAGLPSVSATGRRLTTRDELREVASVKDRVYGGDTADLLEQLAFELDNTPDYLSVYVAYVDDAPAATAWIRFPEASAFSSLWG